jgi:hypothetical protein
VFVKRKCEEELNAFQKKLQCDYEELHKRRRRQKDRQTYIIWELIVKAKSSTFSWGCDSW